MANHICLDNNYSTTRMTTKEHPSLKHQVDEKIKTAFFLPDNKERKGEGGLRTKGYFKHSYENKPLITVVTVVYNGEEHLEQTIQSVIEQTYDNVEYIIIDGGSTDNTVNIIEKYEDQIDYWVSEPDGGIYYAMNKSIQLVLGEYVIFMNAGDWFINSVIVGNIAKRVEEQKVDYIFGDLNRIDSDGNIEIHKGDIKTYKKYTPIGHQALFVKRTVLKEIPFDTQYRIMADYDMMIKFIKQRRTYIYTDSVIANFVLGGISSMDSGKDKERFHIQYKNFGLLIAIAGYIRGTKHPYIYSFVQYLLELKRKYVK